jgi:hypothetical protein
MANLKLDDATILEAITVVNTLVERLKKRACDADSVEGNREEDMDISSYYGAASGAEECLIMLKQLRSVAKEGHGATVKQMLHMITGDQDYTLNDDEYWAVYDWVNAEKDGLPSPLKEGLLKLLNGEMWRRVP